MISKSQFLLLFTFVWMLNASAQMGKKLSIQVLSDNGVPIAAATAVILTEDSTHFATQVSDEDGHISFGNWPKGNFHLKITHASYETFIYTVKNIESLLESGQVFILETVKKEMENVVVKSKKPFIQVTPEKTILNVDAGITNAGSTAMDVLEKSPGVSVGRDGTIMLKGKPDVMVLIDGKQTQLSGADLQAYLSGINASQVDVIELIENPGAKYDAAGNGGIINIVTKKNKQKGFNGNISLSAGQGIYAKTNNSINLNYMTGKWNFFANYGNRISKERRDIGALRKYMDKNGNDSLWLDQPNRANTDVSSHTIKAGVDFLATPKTQLGVAFTGSYNDRKMRSHSTIDWMKPNGAIDSTIKTWGDRNIYFDRSGVTASVRHNWSAQKELSADFDFVKFDISGDQIFYTHAVTSSEPAQATRGNLPSYLDILTAKIDYSQPVGSWQWGAGVKMAQTKTDNLAEYEVRDGSGTWQADLGRSNHFLYDEKINAIYSTLQGEKDKWKWQLGLRYEYTSYKAHQLGNAVAKDSAFHNKYGSLFPSGFASYTFNDNNQFTLRFGKRIDRPPFQALNPFRVTMNKYTYEQGNPYIQPQYSWNVDLMHSYKQMLMTTLSYSYTKDYFSQLFVLDSSDLNVDKNIMIYSRGNVGTFLNLGASVTFQKPITDWWQFSTTGIYNYKKIKGVVWEAMETDIHQFRINMNNRFNFKKGWSAELTGFYQTKSLIDLQEPLTPQKEMSVGVGKQILKGKGALRLNVSDIFYSLDYSGYSYFENSHEPFEVKWDSRVIRFTFSWRFGKELKSIKRSSGSASEETQRVGS